VFSACHPRYSLLNNIVSVWENEISVQGILAHPSLPYIKGCRSINKPLSIDSILDWPVHHSVSHPNTHTLQITAPHMLIYAEDL